MANSKDKNPKSKEETEEEIQPDELQETPEYETPPNTQGLDKQLEEQLVNEWDHQEPPVFDRLMEEEMLPEMGENGESLHTDAYKRISPEEFDEFDSLLDEETSSDQQTKTALSPPQMKLLEDSEVDDIGRIFEDEEEVSPDDIAESVVDAPIEVEEETAMTNEPLPQDDDPEPYEEPIEEPPPNFEDTGMGGGFFIAEDELQPTAELLPEEVEYKPIPLPDDPMEGSQETPEAFVSDIFFAPGPTVEIHDPPEIVGDLPADSSLVEQEVTSDRVSKLIYRAEMARRRINDEIDSIELARDLLELIRSSTTLILSGKDNYEEADRSLNEVEFRLSYSRRVKVWSEAIAYKLLAYEVFWLLFLGLGALFIPSILSVLLGELKAFSPGSLPDFIVMDDLFLGVSTALWGGLGGVVGAMYSLWRHVSLKQDFNPQHKMWYYTQPIMGIPIGVVIFLFFRIGFGFTVDGVIDISSPYFIYMLAWIAGFQQNILYEIIRQILRLFRLQN